MRNRVNEAQSKSFGFSSNRPLIRIPLESAVDATQDTARFSNKTTSWLRKLKLGDAIFTRFLQMKGSSTVHRKLIFAYYAVPTAFVFMVASLNCVQQSFMVYLRYQAMVDSYYFNVVKQDSASSEGKTVQKAFENLTSAATVVSTDKVDG
jgi:hypothetical protein